MPFCVILVFMYIIWSDSCSLSLLELFVKDVFILFSPLFGYGTEFTSLDVEDKWRTLNKA